MITSRNQINLPPIRCIGLTFITVMLPEDKACNPELVSEMKEAVSFIASITSCS